MNFNLRFFLLLCLTISVFIPSANANDILDQARQALDLIRDFSNELCGEIPIGGNKADVELSSSAKAKLKGLFKKIADLELGGDAKYHSSEYRGLLQADLADALRDNQKCRIQVWNDLKHMAPEIVVKEVNIDGSTLSLTLSSIRSVTKLVKENELPIRSSGSLTISDIEKLASEFGLLDETHPNVHLSFLGGDIAYWSEQGLSENRYRLEFSARKVVLDAAREAHLVIKDQGTLSWASQQVMAAILEEHF